MNKEPELADAAQLFKVLGNESRLWLLRLISREPQTVGQLTEATGMTQPLVSQHLRTLRDSALVIAGRSGKRITYSLADKHVAHVMDDTLIHVRESSTPVHNDNQN